MTIILKQDRGNYKKTYYTHIAKLPGNEPKEFMQFYIDDIDAIVVQYENGQWWVISNDPKNDVRFSELGPYETVEDAVIMLKLSATTTSYYYD